MRGVGGCVMIAMVCVLRAEILTWLPALLREDAMTEVGGGARPGRVVGVVGELVAPTMWSEISVRFTLHPLTSLAPRDP